SSDPMGVPQYLLLLEVTDPHPGFHLGRDPVEFKEVFEMREFHCITLDEDEVNALGGIFEQPGPLRDLLRVEDRRRNRTVKGVQRLKRSDHFTACGEIDGGGFLPD